MPIHADNPIVGILNEELFEKIRQSGLGQGGSSETICFILK